MSESQSEKHNVNQMILDGKYDQAIVLLKKSLKQSPDCHWSLFELSSAYYEKRKYKTALKYARIAMEICPTCPTGNWHYASALVGVALHCRKSESAYILAYGICKNILERRVRGLDRDPCSEGHEYNLGLINDFRFMIAMVCIGLKQNAEAKRWFRIFLSKHNVNCMMDKDSAHNFLNNIS